MPRTNGKLSEQEEKISSNDHFNIVDLLLLDHTYLKECIEILTDEDEDKKVKIKYAKGFLDALKKHSAGEKKALYTPLLEAKEFRSMILESEIEHGIIDGKVKMLTPKIASMRSLSEEMEAEMKVLAEVVEHHIDEEEDELFPQMRDEIDSTMLNEMGFQFMVNRQFTEKDLEDVPELQEEVSFLKKGPKIPAGKFLSRTHDYFSGGSAHR